MIAIRNIIIFIFTGIAFGNCSKDSSQTPPPQPPGNFTLSSWSVNGISSKVLYHDVSKNPVLAFKFSTKIDPGSVASAVSFWEKSGSVISYNTTYQNSDSQILVIPAQPLSNLASYRLTIGPQLKSTAGGNLNATTEINFVTSIDSSRKFPEITEDELLTHVQKQTFKYFWDFGHPVSGLARERNSSGDIVTSGGSGFGIMVIIAGIHRNFVTRAEGLARVQKIVGFLKNSAQRFHGAYPHWLNGSTGVAVPFSAKDDGADLVETSYLMQGLLTARQYFDGTGAEETALRNGINSLWNDVEWDWFRQNNQDVLYWHWSPNYSWEMNHQIKGWNECLITYVLAASSITHPIAKSVYDNGWASGGGMINNNSYYGIQLPLGQAYGGPLFFAQYSFLGINPGGLTDAYANYWDQNRNHTLINFTYCKTNSNNNFGYSDSCWGLTASDIPGGYTASSPTNDVTVIAPTAALSSFPYTPVESMKALKFFYYVLGDKIWKDYGFVDAFSLHQTWFADSFLAIDQGPAVVMIENYRSGLFWDLFMSCPEIKTGMLNLGFQSPHL